MTIVVGIRCKDGIVIACDSQTGFSRGVEVKRLNTNKIYPIGKRYALAGSGTIAQIRTLVENVSYAINEEERKKGNQPLNSEECFSVLYTTLLALHKLYNIDRAAYLEIEEDELFFDPFSILCARTEDGGDNDRREHCLFILHPDALVEPIDDFGTAGSGSAFAELVLEDLYHGGITVEEGITAALYTIDAVKNKDPDCGGPTKLGILREDFKEMADDEIRERLRKIRPILDAVRKDLIPKVLRGEIDEAKIKTL